MRKKLYNILKKTYGILMFIAFFGGFIPVIPFIVALIVGGPVAEAIATFCYNDFYPYVIAIASVAIVVGLVGMYIGKIEGLSVKNVSASDDNQTN